MFIAGSTDCVRNLPATALFGTHLLFFLFFATIFFLIPVIVVSAELTRDNAEQGGIYTWVESAFGEKPAVIAIWLQWITPIIWYPTVLSFLAANIAYLINPQLAQNKFYLVSVILLIFSSLTMLNLKGTNTSAKFASICAIIGMLLPMILLAVLITIWLVVGNPSQIHFTSSNILPDITDTQNWVSLTATIAAFLGVELSTVHVKSVSNSVVTFPRALFLSAFLIFMIVLFGSFSIATVVPASQISFVDGVIQVFAHFFKAYHLHFLVPAIALMLILGSIGEMINWMISPAKGLLYAAKNGYFPPLFSKVNHHNAPNVIMIVQAILVSFVTMAFLFMPSVNGSYWLLTALNTQIYVIMYVFMFVSAFKLRYKQSKIRSFKNKCFFYFIILLGLAGCFITIGVDFIPPKNINVGSPLHYILIYLTGMFLMILPIPFLFLYKTFSNKRKRLIDPILEPIVN